MVDCVTDNLHLPFREEVRGGRPGVHSPRLEAKDIKQSTRGEVCMDKATFNAHRRALHFGK